MDPSSIDTSDIAERYLSGDLSLREAREFEKYCLAHPEVVATLPIPVRLKTRLAGRRLSEEDALAELDARSRELEATVAAPEEPMVLVDEEPPPRLRLVLDRPLVIYALLGALVLVMAGLVFAFLRNGELRHRIHALEDAARSVSLRPPATLQTFLLKPDHQGLRSEPDLALRWPDPPELIELRIDVSQGKYSSFAITIDKFDEARILQIRRIAADSNRELRLALNSSAFGPGEYHLKIEAYTWRGEVVDYGWLRIELRQ
jgi:hypothetical protein